MNNKRKKGKINLIELKKKILSTMLLISIIGINTIIFPNETYAVNTEGTYSGLSIYAESRVINLNEGDTVTIIINANENMETLASFDGYLSYDTDVFELLSEDNQNNEWEAIAKKWNNDFCYEENSSLGKLYIGCANSSTSKYDANGDLMKFTLTVKKQADISTIKLENTNVLTSEGKCLEGNDSECTVGVEAELKSTITFVDNSGDSTVIGMPTNNQDMAVTGEKYTLPTLTREGYRLVGWNTEDGGTGTEYLPEETITIEDDMVLYTQWKKEYKISYNANTEDEVTNLPEQAKILDGEEYEVPKIIPQRTGYWFVKWTTNSDGTGNSYILTDIINAEANIELYAQWKKIYTISYNSNTEDEVNDVPEKESKLENDEYTISSTKPTREGYKFISWNTEIDGTGTEYTSEQVITITEDLELYAQWKKEYAISIGNDGEEENIIILEGEEYTIPENPSKEGYRFIEWNSKEDGSGTRYTAGDKITVSENVEIHAIWKKEYSISISNDGEEENIIILEGEEYTIPENLSKEGYRFIEWNSKEDGTGTTYTAGDKITVGENIEIYAIWKKECTVIYGSEGTTEILLEGDEFTLPEVEEQDGYRFIEWNTEEDGTGTSYQVGDKIIVSDDINLYEIWKEEYFVTYHAEETTMEIALEGENYKISSTIPKKEGHKFIEWNTEEDGTGITYLPEQEIILEDNLDLYAQFKEVYTIKYNSNIDDEVNNLPEQEEIFKGEEYTISNKVPERTGYRFMGWNTKEDGTGEKYSSEQNVTLESSIELFAIWKKEYVITINEDNNDENPTTIVMLEGEEYIIPTATAKEGYRFMGWNTQPDGTGTTYQEGESVTLQDNFKIYQIWKKEFTISYNASEGATSEVEAEITLENEKYTISNTIPEREGFMFIGWNTKEDGTGRKYVPGETIIIKENLNIYAQWKENTYDEESGKLYLSTGIYKIGDNNINNYENGDLYITKIQAETKLTDYIKQIYTNGNIAVYNTEGTQITEDDIIATGMKLVVTKDEEKIELTIAVIGDLDSNGKITITDLSEMNKALIEVKSLEGEYKLAADFDDNNKITITDLSMINKELLK